MDHTKVTCTQVQLVNPSMNLRFLQCYDLLWRAFIQCCAPWQLSPPSVATLHNTGHPSGAAVCEWALVMLFFCLFGLFAAEFRHINGHHLTVQKHAVGNDCSPASIEMNGHVHSTTNAVSWPHTKATIFLGCTYSCCIVLCRHKACALDS